MKPTTATPETKNPYLKAVFWFDLMEREEREAVCLRYPKIFFYETSRIDVKYSDLLKVYNSEKHQP